MHADGEGYFCHNCPYYEDVTLIVPELSLKLNPYLLPSSACALGLPTHGLITVAVVRKLVVVSFIKTRIQTENCHSGKILTKGTLRTSDSP